MGRNSEAAYIGSAMRYVLGALKKFARAQSDYSVVTSAVPGILALMFIADLTFGHEHLNHVNIIVWLVTFGVLATVPLIAGKALHRNAGLLMIAVVYLWSWDFVSRTDHAHTELNGILQVPMLALYVGWFYPTAIARVALTINLMVITLAMASHGWDAGHEYSSVIALGYALTVSLFCVELASFMRCRAAEQSQTDQLTGVYNRRGLVEVGTRVFAEARAAREPIVVGVIDFDDFKSVNDNGGHAEGDEALRATAHTWVAGLNSRDVVARTGGDEFALIIHGDCVATERKLRDICASAPYAWSWGITAVNRDDTLDDALRRADAEMYRSKQKG